MDKITIEEANQKLSDLDYEAWMAFDGWGELRLDGCFTLKQLEKVIEIMKLIEE